MIVTGEVIQRRREALRETLVYLRDEVLPEGYQFDMNAWCVEDAKCQTFMCLGGWYVHRHPEHGLKLHQERAGGGGYITDRDNGEPSVFGTRTLLQVHFDLTYEESHSLFMPDAYPFAADTQEVAAQAIKRLDTIIRSRN